MGIRDRINDLLIDLGGRRGRVFLLILAVALSTGAMISSIGLSRTASVQVSNEIAASITDEITISANGASPAPMFDSGALDRVRELDMVEDCGLRIDVDASAAPVTRLRSGPEGPNLNVVGATSGYLRLRGIDVPSPWMLDGDTRTVILGSTSAAALGIPPDTTGGSFTLHVADQPFSVIAVLDQDNAEFSSAVLISYASAVAFLGNDQTARLLVGTSPGAGARVSEVVRQAINPSAPTSLIVTRVADLRDVRQGVDDQLAVLVAAIGALLVLLTILLVANSMVVNVVGRTSEIGLRRALGTSTSGITLMFLTEGAFVGLLGGIAGSVVGVWSLVVVSMVNQWSPVLDVGPVALGPALGLTICVIASLYPARKAARISPAQAVRME